MNTWVGHDVARAPSRLSPRLAAIWLCLALIGGLSVAALRVDGIRVRYELAEIMAEERRLIEENRLLTVEMRKLRDPARLASRARELGFGLPESVIDGPARIADLAESARLATSTHP